jgi:hypothetical protein
MANVQSIEDSAHFQPNAETHFGGKVKVLREQVIVMSFVQLSAVILLPQGLKLMRIQFSVQYRPFRFQALSDHLLNDFLLKLKLF